MRTQRLIAYAFTACLVSLLAGTAMADVGSGNFNAFLQGKYQVSANISCATGSAPELIGDETPVHITFAGVITYDGHGLAKLTDHGLVINNGTGSALGFDEVCDFSYEVARDGSFSQKGSCTGTDGSYKLTFITWAGQIGVGGLVLITNQVGTTASVLEVPAAPPTTFIQFRRCGGVGTAVRIHPQ
jgi:hypothetical protein